VAPPAAVNRTQPVAPITVRHHTPVEAAAADRTLAADDAADFRPLPTPRPAAAAATTAETDKAAPGRDGNGASPRTSPFTTRPAANDGRREQAADAPAGHASQKQAPPTRLADQPISPQAAEAARAKLRPHHAADDGPVIGATSED
jgi:hypothetical protein